jgi:hypothetical protein
MSISMQNMGLFYLFLEDNLDLADGLPHIEKKNIFEV